MFNSSTFTKATSIRNPIVLGVLALSQAIFGCGIGMLLADRMDRSSTRRNTAFALLAVAVLAHLPSGVGRILELLNAPGTSRGSEKLLRSIRGDVEGRAQPTEDLLR